MGTPLAGRDGGVAVLSGAVNRVDSASAKPCLDDSEAKSPILIFLYFHKAIRTELDELQRSAMAFATGQLNDIQPLFERYDFVRSIYKHHSNAEDESQVGSWKPVLTSGDLRRSPFCTPITSNQSLGCRFDIAGHRRGSIWYCLPPNCSDLPLTRSDWPRFVSDWVRRCPIVLNLSPIWSKIAPIIHPMLDLVRFGPIGLCSGKLDDWVSILPRFYSYKAWFGLDLSLTHSIVPLEVRLFFILVRPTEFGATEEDLLSPPDFNETGDVVLSLRVRSLPIVRSFFKASLSICVSFVLYLWTVSSVFVIFAISLFWYLIRASVDLLFLRELFWYLFLKVLFAIMTLLPPTFTEFQQYRAFLATIQGDSTKASVMTTLSGLHSSPPKAAPVTKEDFIYLDSFPSYVPTEEYSSTLNIADIPLPATYPEVSDYPPPPTTSSLPSLIPSAPLVYSRHRAASPIPSSSSVAPSFDSGNPVLPASRH
ncbi:hypothetical protein Acr_26g0001130 [Actinidia rufa]|uniref:Uncharacterized protein n=1 Tax=Actinidia rufa TaxID=165716 RepID=A0A7J0H178_9ERIC|nr:hypothetical protein Acr_26g0001130 [Actinidia rufa]